MKEVPSSIPHLLEPRTTEMATTGAAIKRVKLRSNHYQHQAFYTPDAVPVAQPTASGH